MIDIRSLGYVRVDSTDLEEWRTFGGQVLGLVESRGPSPDNLYFRMDEVSARIVVAPARRDQGPVFRQFHRTNFERDGRHLLAQSANALCEITVGNEFGVLPGDEQQVAKALFF